MKMYNQQMKMFTVYEKGETTQKDEQNQTTTIKQNKNTEHDFNSSYVDAGKTLNIKKAI